MVESTDLDVVFSALADRTRRAILARLRAGDACVGEIAEPFPISLAAVSKHIDVLERAGLVRRETHGRQRRCRLAPGALQAAADWTEPYRELWTRRLDALEGSGSTRRRRDRRSPT